MNAKNISKFSIDGVPALRFSIDGKFATIAVGAQKLTLLNDYGIICLGENFENDPAYEVILPADDSKGMPKTTIYGATNDPDIVAMCKRFLNAQS